MRFFSSYRNRMRIRRIVLTLLIVLLAAAVLGIAVLIYLDRYIVYDQDGAHLRFRQEAAESESAAVSTVDAEIAYVSEDDEAAIGSSRKITGYYITGEMLRDVDALRAALAGKEYYALLFDMKDVYGNFYYPRTLSEASTAASVDAQAVSSLLSELRRGGSAGQLVEQGVELLPHHRRYEIVEHLLVLRRRAGQLVGLALHAAFGNGGLRDLLFLYAHVFTSSRNCPSHNAL